MLVWRVGQAPLAQEARSIHKRGEATILVVTFIVRHRPEASNLTITPRLYAVVEGRSGPRKGELAEWWIAHCLSLRIMWEHGEKHTFGLKRGPRSFGATERNTHPALKADLQAPSSILTWKAKLPKITSHYTPK